MTRNIGTALRLGAGVGTVILVVSSLDSTIAADRVAWTESVATALSSAVGAILGVALGIRIGSFLDMHTFNRPRNWMLLGVVSGVSFYAVMTGANDTHRMLSIDAVPVPESVLAMACLSAWTGSLLGVGLPREKSKNRRADLPDDRRSRPSSPITLVNKEKPQS